MPAVAVEADRAGLEPGYPRGLLPEEQDDDRAEAVPRLASLGSQQAAREFEARTGFSVTSRYT